MEKISRIEDAIKITHKAMREGIRNINDYRAALEYIIDNHDDLKFHIYFNLGGEFFSDSPSWDKVCAGSEARCGCGNERIIRPLSYREYYQHGSSSVEVSRNNPVYLRPVGGDDLSAYLRLSIVKNYILMYKEPLAPKITHGVMERDYKSALKLPEVHELMQTNPGDNIDISFDNVLPLFRFNNINLEKSSARIDLDKDVEYFTPEKNPKPTFAADN